jgi:methionine-gamma-lyase
MRMTRRLNTQQGFATRAIHLGYDPATEHGALTPPIYMISTYTFETAEDGAALFRNEREGYVYGRTKNPTQDLLEQRLADLEGAEAGLALASGMAAIASTLWTLLSAGDQIIVDRILYGNTFALITRGLTKFGVEAVVADFTDPNAVQTAIGPRTKLIYFETPANPNLRIIDITAITSIARQHGVLAIVDNTFATPALQRPIEHGADLVVHSAIKYLGGHGDLLGGIVVGGAERIKQIRLHGLRYLTGATLSPMAAFLILRGLKTLELRMHQHCVSAVAVAELLSRHPMVTNLAYPGLADPPAGLVAARQMQRGGGLVAFELAGGTLAGLRFMDELSLIHRAVSLGGTETLVQHPASMTHAAYSAEERAHHGISDGLLRLSIGLETTQDILDDISAALDALH